MFQGDTENDTWIFVLAVLLSSTLIYNSKGTIDQQAMDNLQYPLWAHTGSPLLPAWGPRGSHTPVPCVGRGNLPAVPRDLLGIPGAFLPLPGGTGLASVPQKAPPVPTKCHVFTGRGCPCVQS